MRIILVRGEKGWTSRKEWEEHREECTKYPSTEMTTHTKNATNPASKTSKLYKISTKIIYKNATPQQFLAEKRTKYLITHITQEEELIRVYIERPLRVVIISKGVIVWQGPSLGTISEI